jgi:hypothetical protein
MPVGKGSYKMVKTKTGKMVRLHFTSSGKVNEAKNMKTGATHTPAEFRADAKRSATRKTVRKLTVKKMTKGK